VNPDSDRVAIRWATTAEDVALARALFVEYAKWLNVDLCFQGFDRELATLPGAYAPPGGRLLIVGAPGEAFGCVALRALGGDGTSTGEIKRLFVRPAARKGGWGHRLVDALIAEARVIGYRELKLDTLAWMTEARSLYAQAGFRACAPYYANPLEGAVYMAMTL
jgi:GNAT superfamily N-acetyltransferase